MTPHVQRAAAGDRGGVPREPDEGPADAWAMMRARRCSTRDAGRRRSRCTSACGSTPQPVLDAAAAIVAALRARRQAAACSATAAARPTRSTSPRNWSAGSSASARRWPAIALTTDTQRADERSPTTTRSTACSPGRSRRSAGRATWRSASATSGASPNVRARRSRRRAARGLQTIALTGARRRRGRARGGRFTSTCRRTSTRARAGSAPDAAARDLRPGGAGAVRTLDA